jgi:hypothetical protein
MANISITLTTNANQDTALTRLLVKLNAERAMQTPPLAAIPDVTTMLRSILQNAVQDYLRQFRQEQKDVVGVAMETATNAQIQQVATTLGVALP